MSGAAGGDDVKTRLSPLERRQVWAVRASPPALVEAVERILADRLRAERAEGAREALKAFDDAIDEMAAWCGPYGYFGVPEFINRRDDHARECIRARAAAHATQDPT